MLDQPKLVDALVLLAEDEYLIAEAIEGALSAQGAIVVGPVPSTEWAIRLVGEWDRIDGAVVDLRLGSELAFPLVDKLLDASVPVVLNTGYAASALPERYRHLPCCEKALPPEAVAQTLAQAILAKKVAWRARQTVSWRERV